MTRTSDRVAIVGKPDYPKWTLGGYSIVHACGFRRIAVFARHCVVAVRVVRGGVDSVRDTPSPPSQVDGLAENLR